MHESLIAYRYDRQGLSDRPYRTDNLSTIASRAQPQLCYLCYMLIKYYEYGY